MTSTLTFRPARDDERHVVRRLAQLDSASVPHGEVVLAVESGRAVAAMSVLDGRVVADPFVPTLATVELLREHVTGVREGRMTSVRSAASARRRRRVRRASLRLA